MQIFLIRHADAVHDQLAPDEHRYLSAAGRATCRAVGARLRAEGIVLDAVLASPLVRAVQTAELLAQAIGFDQLVETVGALAPGVPPEVAAGLLAAHGNAVAVVGHEPGMSALGALLIGRPAFLPFGKSQVTLVEDGRARWTLSPRTLQLTPMKI